MKIAEIKKQISKMTNKQLMQKYNAMIEQYEANIEIDLERYFCILDEVEHRKLL